MEPKENCKICNAEILATTAARTGGVCMPCQKDPKRLESRKQYLMESKVIDRKVPWAEVGDPHEVITAFESLCFGDGLDQAFPDELVNVLAVLKRCKATECRGVISDLLDFIEAGCSPDGYYEPNHVEAFLASQGKKLDEFVERYQIASLAENPAERALKID